MKQILYLTFLCSVIFFSPCALSEDMWRVDFLHSGGAGANESISQVTFTKEPLPWTANKFDELERGDYKIEVRLKKTEELIYSRSFSSIYSDWSKSNDAGVNVRSFEESVRFPKPKSEAYLLIYKRVLSNQNMPFKKVKKLDIPLTIDAPHHQVDYAQTFKDLLINGNPQDKFDLLVLAEGFTLKEQQKFFDAAAALTESLFLYSPFKNLKNSFNVRATFTAPPTNCKKTQQDECSPNSVFEVSANALGMARYVLSERIWRINDAAMASHYDGIVILLNSSEYGASGIYSTYSIIPAFNEHAAFLLLHELGHSLAGLADEYFTGESGYSESQNIVEPYEPNITALLPGSPLKWSSHVRAETPIPTPWHHQQYLDSQRGDYSWLASESFRTEVGAFKGANYNSEKFYRPTLNCLMFQNTGDNGFCPVCSHAIEQVIQAENTNHDSINLNHVPLTE